MDSGTTIFGLMLLLICILPIILLTRKRKKREKLFLQSLFRLAEKSNSKVTERDLWNNTAIGLAKESNKLFFTRKTADNHLLKEINITEMQKCRVVNTSRTVSTPKGVNTVIDKLELALTYLDKNRPEILLEFYSTDHDSFSLSGELQLTEKWKEIINSAIAGSTV
jgi:hypothetical protein